MCFDPFQNILKDINQHTLKINQNLVITLFAVEQESEKVFLGAWRGVWDRSCLTRGQARAPALEVWTPNPARDALIFYFLFLKK